MLNLRHRAGSFCGWREVCLSARICRQHVRVFLTLDVSTMTTLRVALVAPLVAILTLIRTQQHCCVAIVPQNQPSKITTRRAVLTSIPGAIALAQPLLLTSPQDAHASDTPLGPPPGSNPLVPGSRIQYQPTGDGLSWSPPTLATKLAQSRIGAKELSPLNPKLSPFSDQEMYYPEWMFGSWNVTAVLKRKLYPYGVEVLPSRSLVEGSPRNRQEKVGEDGTSYEVHYYSTLADTVANQVTVNLGLGVPQSKIIADRAFSARSISRAYQQLTPVEEVEWDTRKDPTRVTLYFGAGPLANDMRPLGERRTEIYITARDSEQSFEDNVFCACERTRIVQLSPGNAAVSDTETTTEYTLVNPNTITAISRIAVYLTPNPNSREGVLWQKVGGKAVAFYDYEMEMKRNEEVFFGADGKELKKACVLTPKDVIQCA